MCVWLQATFNILSQVSNAESVPGAAQYFAACNLSCELLLQLFRLL